MPELPEVETVARTLRPQVQDRYIGKTEILFARTLQAGHDLLPLLTGAKIVNARRRAKVLLLDVLTAAASRDVNSEPLILAFHLKMTGQLFVHGLEVEPNKHTKIVFGLHSEQEQALQAGGVKLAAQTNTGSMDNQPQARLFFDDMRTFGYCRIMRPKDLQDWAFWNKLGLEPLEHSANELAERFAAKKGRIKNVLLDQEVVCGIGNIYADEALFRAGIRPDVKTDALAPSRLLKLGTEVQAVLQESIAACGSSIRDYRDANGNVGAFQNTFKAYGRGGEPCTLCGTIMTACRVAGRGTCYCGKCQK
ncbi:MAG: bifunctional DNA-formamidopyrimidine glycosylase/DNA-(apurinic or apyrimidinic site) lyase [Deltaproteobacteria bacterium]|jgi:formamidopyrimidine-DNA glycosylase|nr:bifunctional DNA-formamidopyrimidine glycosylase/DNA-(apurinic or apyrimidinic site) lyase [Deltaproteobacteria bacterium]